jgi:hypothetical protein
MSRDDDDSPWKLDYAQTFPAGTRNRKRRAAAPRSKEPKRTPSRFTAKLVSKKIIRSSPESRRDARRRMDDRPQRSMATAAREMIIRDISLTVDELVAKLEAQGFEAAPLTISTFRSDTRAVLKIAQELDIDLQKLEFS